jgi:DNA-binding response OmpR family regulator
MGGHIPVARRQRPLAFIVEVDHELAELFVAALEVAGYQTEAFHDGETALRRLMIAAPDLIVTDLVVPRVSGLVLIYLTRAQQRLQRTRLALVLQETCWGQSLAHKVDFVLAKPRSVTELQELVGRLQRPS